MYMEFNMGIIWFYEHLVDIKYHMLFPISEGCLYSVYFKTIDCLTGGRY